MFRRFVLPAGLWLLLFVVPEKLLPAPRLAAQTSGARAACANRSTGADLAPPTGSIRITGPSIRIDNRLYVAQAVGLEVEAADEGSGLAGWSPVIDGREASLASWTGLWSAGEHTAGAIVEDLCGNRHPVEPVSFIVDAEPPSIQWKAAGPPPEQLEGGWRRALRRDRSRPKQGLFWVPSDPEARLRWDERWASSPAGTVHQSVEVASDLPTIFVRLEGVRLLSDGAAITTGEEAVVRLDATDGGSRVTKMVLRTRSTAGGPVLEAEAVDGVGNSSRLELKIEHTGAS